MTNSPIEPSIYLLEFKKEFENEKPTELAPSQPRQIDQDDERSKKEESETSIDLNMEVFEDKDYDIEEVKFWNFISKSKGAKPNLIRTYVYKVPESTYVVKRCKLPKPRTSISPKNK